MNGIDIIDIKQMNIKGAYVIDGFPSVGLVGSIVANYLVSFLKLEQIAMVDSVYFPAISLIRDEMPLAPVRVYAGAFGSKGQEKIVVFVSEFQPDPEILKSLAITIMDWAEDHKCKMMISPEGLLTREETERLEAMAMASKNLGNGCLLGASPHTQEGGAERGRSPSTAWRRQHPQGRC